MSRDGFEPQTSRDAIPCKTHQTTATPQFQLLKPLVVLPLKHTFNIKNIPHPELMSA